MSAILVIGMLLSTIIFIGMWVYLALAVTPYDEDDKYAKYFRNFWSEDETE